MKLDKKRDNDCYFLIEDGEIKEVQIKKEYNTINIMKQKKAPIKQIKEDDVYESLNKYIKNMPTKSKVNRILKSSIITTSILLIISLLMLFNSILKSPESSITLILNNQSNKTQIKNDLFTLSNEINNLNQNIKQYYDLTYNEILTNNTKNSTKLVEVKKYISKDLDSINNFNKIINTNNFKEIINILNMRLENTNKLIDKISKSKNTNCIEIYNKYAKDEILLESNLNEHIIAYFKHLNISYNINNNFISFKE